MALYTDAVLTRRKQRFADVVKRLVDLVKQRWRRLLAFWGPVTAWVVAWFVFTGWIASGMRVLLLIAILGFGVWLAAAHLRNTPGLELFKYAVRRWAAGLPLDDPEPS